MLCGGRVLYCPYYQLDQMLYTPPDVEMGGRRRRRVLRRREEVVMRWLLCMLVVIATVRIGECGLCDLRNFL